MTTEIQVIYRQGIPTKSSIKQLVRAFDRKLKARPNVLYSPKKPYIIWYDDYTQSRIEQFINWASEVGVLFGEYQAVGEFEGRLHFCIQK